MSAARRHLFLATGSATFGEALMGIDLARALHTEGDYVAFLHPSALAVLFHGQPFRHGIVDFAMGDLAATVAAVAAEQRIDTVVLVDLTSVLYSVGAATVRELVGTWGPALIGVDLWDLPATDLIWDVGEHVVPIDPITCAIPALRPCPIARPDAPGAYDALPALVPLDARTRAQVRAEFGIPQGAPMIVATTGSWQLPANHPHAGPNRLARALPALYELVQKQLPGVYLLHVGPQAFAWGATAPRYRHVAQTASARFRAILGAADLFLSVNIAATSIAAAVAMDVPVAVLATGARGASVADLQSQFAPFPSALRAWLDAIVPLRPFRVCPIGLHDLLTPVLRGNPYAEALIELEFLDHAATITRLRELVEGDGARTDARAGQARFRARVAALPSATTRFRELTR